MTSWIRSFVDVILLARAPTFWDMVGFESFFIVPGYFTCFLVYLSKLVTVPIKCNTPAEEKFPRNFVRQSYVKTIPYTTKICILTIYLTTTNDPTNDTTHLLRIFLFCCHGDDRITFASHWIQYKFFMRTKQNGENCKCNINSTPAILSILE